VLCIISVSIVCLGYFAKCLAGQAASSDAYVEELVSTKASCTRIVCVVVHLHHDQLVTTIITTILF